MKRAILCALLLGACTDQAIIDSAYPDRERFSFRSMDGESVFLYTCASSATPEATRARAEAAHGYFDKRFNAAVDGAALELAKDESQSNSRATGRALDAEMEDIVEQTEARYQCLFADAQDT